MRDTDWLPDAHLVTRRNPAAASRSSCGAAPRPIPGRPVRPLHRRPPTFHHLVSPARRCRQWPGNKTGINMVAASVLGWPASEVWHQSLPGTVLFDGVFPAARYANVRETERVCCTDMHRIAVLDPDWIVLVSQFPSYLLDFG